MQFSFSLRNTALAAALLALAGCVQDPLASATPDVIAEQVGRGGGVIQKARSPQVHVLPKMEAKQSVVKRFRQHIEALDLRRDVQPNALVCNVLDG